MIKKLSNKLSDSGIDASQLLLYCLAMIPCFLCYYFQDMGFTTRHGINVWGALFSGKILNYYSLNMEPYIYTNTLRCPAHYPFPIYIVFAIWDLPLYIYEHLTKTNFLDSTLCILYSKIILFVFFIIAAKAFKRICEFFSFDAKKTNLCFFFWVTSSLFIEPFFVVAQYDIFSIAFTLWGIFYYLKNDNKKFLLFFAIAISFKYFALFAFIPLLLYREKNILKILAYSFIAVIPTLFFRILFFKDMSGISQAMNLSMGLISYIRSGIQIHFNEVLIPSFFLAYVIFVFVLYFAKPGNNPVYAILLPLISFSIFFVLCFSHFYWIILISPYIALLVFINENYEKNILLELIFSTAFILRNFLQEPFYFNPQAFNLSPIRNFAEFDWKDTVFSVSRLFSLGKYDWLEIPLIICAFAVGLIYFIIFNSKKRETQIISALPVKDTFKALTWLRLCVNLFLCLFQLLLLIPANILLK